MTAGAVARPPAAAVRTLLVATAVLGFALSGGAGTLESDLAGAAPELDREVLRLALDAVECARADGTADSTVLTVIDYSLPSTEPRLWVFDLARGELLFRELVAHGRNTGENHATDFSNRHGSKQSSLGLFWTAGTYHGRNGYSLKLHGLEEGVNHNALDRTIVLHGAWYVSEDFARQHGRLGRSWGCPAVRTEVAKPLIDTIKDGSFLFVYYPDEGWLESSGYLQCTDTATPSEAWTPDPTTDLPDEDRARK